MEPMSLFWRVVAINAAVVVAAVLVLILSPARVSSAPTSAEIEVLIGGTLLVIALNVVLLRRVFGPLERLAHTMRRVDPHDPGRRVALKKPVAEVAELAGAFNDMLDRLEDERQGSARRALAAQEGERLRGLRQRLAQASAVTRLLAPGEDSRDLRVDRDVLVGQLQRAGAQLAGAVAPRGRCVRVGRLLAQLHRADHLGQRGGQRARPRDRRTRARRGVRGRDPLEEDVEALVRQRAGHERDFIQPE
jgi:HAMP domain-containing protein